MTVAVLTVRLPAASAHCTARVYTRPGPLPARSARSLTLNGPVICQSGAVSPSPNPLTGSELLTLVSWQTGTALQASVAVAPTVTATIL